MKHKAFLIIITLLLLGLAACSLNNGSNTTQPNDVQKYRSTGVVKAIDASGGMITIDHQDIPEFMGAMQMTWPVKNISALATLKPGDKVEFEIEKTGMEVIVSSLTKTGEVGVIEGADIYKTNCAKCHGDNGEGRTKGIPLISGHALSHSEAEFVKQVSDGKTGKMPAFRDKLTPDEIKSVVDFVRGTLQKGLVRDSGGHKH